MEIKYFYVTDLIKRGELKIEYCPTEKMIADYFTKPVTGTAFTMLWQQLTNCPFRQCEDTG